MRNKKAFIFSIVTCIIAIIGITFSTLKIIKLDNINIDYQEKVLHEYVKEFDIEKLNVLDKNDEITQEISKNKDGYSIIYKYKNTTLNERYNSNKELFSKEFTNDISQKISFFVILISLSVVLFITAVWTLFLSNIIN